jgi:oligosaccharide repeat unit polymerase
MRVSKAQPIAQSQSTYFRERGISLNYLHLYFLLSVVSLGLLLSLTSQLRDLALADLSKIASLLALILTGMTIRVTSYRIWSASAVYIAVFCIFHFGLTFVYGLGLPTGIEYYLSQWFYSPATNYAVILAGIGLVSCAIGISVALSVSKQRQTRADDVYLDHSFSLVGLFLIITSSLAWFYFVISTGGLQLLTASYQTYLEATVDAPMPIVQFLFYVGMVFLACVAPSRLRKLGFIMVCIFALFAMPLGLRGEVLFPALAALVIYAKQKIPLTTVKALILGVILLGGIAFLRNIRDAGIQNVRLSEIPFNPLGGLVELGASLRPVSEVVKWHEAGDDFIYGASYWAPIDRLLYYFSPGGYRIPAQEDDRIMNVLVINIKRVGPIGFSPVAEAYRNFGVYGVIVAMFLTGFLLGKMDSWPTSRIWKAVSGCIFVQLLIQIRNSFISVPAQIAIGLLIVCFAVIIAPLFRYASTNSHEILPPRNNLQ